MSDTDRNERIAAPLHPEVVRHAEEYARAVRHYRRPADVVAAADALLAMARGEGVRTSRSTENKRRTP